ncbi:hypothetical protein FW774_08815 [Pedobacter sp. BS3]|uniref:hypothetical protein n=1 Tax=Pedobacter sp. BS3 TaxID=2567937 RepID=UPI0011EE2835|nr:hypothetical protein [Pedobacter sp. BS3]TZF83574.1 hypothetical protein FW774_08815 [Pedobacter sp. BS3]
MKRTFLSLILLCHVLAGFSSCKKGTATANKEKEDTNPPVSTPQQQGALLSATGSKDTYALINSVLGGKGDVVEAPDCAHPDFGKHIREVYDNDLKKYVFAFYLHKSPDNDRCNGKTDRQRNEIKTYDQSPDSLIAHNGESFTYKWKFKLDAGFQPSPGFTHIHQIKPGDGDADMPIITLTARYKKDGDQLELIHTGGSDVNTSLGKVASVDLAPFKGSWVEVTENVTFGGTGKYEITIKSVDKQKVLLSYSTSSIDLWRSQTTFCRPKWGMYRSLLYPDYIRDEEIRFDDFRIIKNK